MLQDRLEDYIERHFGEGWHVTDRALLETDAPYWLYRLWNEHSQRVLFARQAGDEIKTDQWLQPLIWPRHGR